MNRNILKAERKQVQSKPGITGLWQVYGRSKEDFEGLSILDYYYYTNCSFTLDLRIAFDTIKVLIMGIGDINERLFCSCYRSRILGT